MGLAHILLIIQSKSYAHALYRVGAQGDLFLSCDLGNYSDEIKCRCNAAWDNLDGEGGRRSHELTLALFDALDRVALWDDYGIVSDIMASQTYFSLFIASY